jgi:hypothetical protein
MTSDIERPRQRTVAELLAQHGDAASSSRRRRRQSPDDEHAESVATAGVARPLIAQRTSSAAATVAPAPATPHTSRHPSFEPGDNARREAYRAVSRADNAPPPVRPPVHREFPTDVMPRLPDGYDANPDADVTGPIPLAAAAPAALPAKQPPARPADPDGGPPTQFSPGVIEDDPDDDTWADDEWDDTDWDDDESDEDYADDARAAADAEYDQDFRDDLDDDIADQVDEHDDYVDEHDEEADDDAARRRVRTAGSGPTWPAVIAQWIAGAIGGATLWVAFRYLWKGFPVVAVAAALAVTVGLVIIVRALLHNRDLRTTIFAVLVGVLLTASPAILVLIGR